MRVLIADSHANTRRALSLLLQEEKGISAIYEASDAESVIKLAAENAVELVLLDAELPGLPIKDLIDEIHFLIPTPKVIVMSCDLEQGRKFLRDGADAFVSKSDQPEWLLSALRRLV
jgi:DNA-binding NarL/FixJ family response regulator